MTFKVIIYIKSETTPKPRVQRQAAKPLQAAFGGYIRLSLPA